MALPAPEDYKTWQEYARALVTAISAEDPSVPSYNQLPNTQEPPPYVPPDTTPGDGYPPYPVQPVWLNPENALLYLGNAAWNPPVAGDLFVIDTANILDAAIVTAKMAIGSVNRQRLADLAVDAAKLADSAVTSTKIANLAVGTAAIANLAVGSAQIADAAIITVKIGEAQIVEAKIADLAVNTAKIANAAINSAKIANLAVGSAHMQFAAIQSVHIGDAQINNAKIGEFIQSYNWNPANKAGWKLDKNGSFSGQGIYIYDNAGNLILGAGGQIDFSRVTNVNLQLYANAFGQLALWDPEQGDLDSVVLRDAGVSNMAYIDYLHAGNINSYIAGAAIGNALIANAAIGSAQIIDASILSAKIGFGQILNAHIADAQITQAKIGYAAIGSAEIQDGAIGYAEIGAAQIYAVHIADAQITNAKIGNLQVDFAKIGELQVGTQKIAYDAVTQVTSFFKYSWPKLPASGGNWYFLSDGVTNAMISLYKSTANQQAIINLTVAVTRSGGNDDQLSFMCVRHDQSQLPQVYNTMRVTSAVIPWTLQFTDPNPYDGWNNYYIMFQTPVGNPYVYNTTIVGQMVKR